MERHMRNALMLTILVLAGCREQARKDAIPKDQPQPPQPPNGKQVEEQKSDDAARKIVAAAVKAHGGETNIMRLRIARIKYSSSMVLMGKNADIEVELTYQMPIQMKKVTKG